MNGRGLSNYEASTFNWGPQLNCKRAFTTRRAQLDEAQGLVIEGVRPAAGDLVVARVTKLGMHQRIELPTGRRSNLHEGDHILVAYGARYAPDQFEAVVPDDLGPCELVAGGGVAARVLSRHRDVREATKITPLGLLADEKGQILNLRRWTLLERGRVGNPLVIVVVGTSMNAGKTTAASKLIRGCVRGGLRVGAAKVTGTGSGGDVWSMLDAGACEVVDFTDRGHPSTYLLDEDEVVQTAGSLINHLASLHVDVSVVEVADGLLQRETAMLLASSQFSERIDAVLFSAFDSAGAVYGVDQLRRLGLPVVALSGRLSISELGAREASAVTDLPVLTSDQLMDPAFAQSLMTPARPDVGLQKLSA